MNLKNCAFIRQEMLMAMKSNINRRKIRIVVPLAIPETMLLLSSQSAPHILPWERAKGLFIFPFCTSAVSHRRSLPSISSKLNILISICTSVSHFVVVFLQFLPEKVTILLFGGKVN